MTASNASNASVVLFDAYYKPSGPYAWGRFRDISLLHKCDRCRCTTTDSDQVKLRGHVLCRACKAQLELRALRCYMLNTISVVITCSRSYDHVHCKLCDHGACMWITLFGYKYAVETVMLCKACFDGSFVKELRACRLETCNDCIMSCFSNVLPLPARDTIIEMMMCDFDEHVHTQLCVATVRRLETMKTHCDD